MAKRFLFLCFSSKLATRFARAAWASADGDDAVDDAAELDEEGAEDPDPEPFFPMTTVGGKGGEEAGTIGAEIDDDDDDDVEATWNLG